MQGGGGRGGAGVGGGGGEAASGGGSNDVRRRVVKGAGDGEGDCKGEGDSEGKGESGGTPTAAAKALSKGESIPSGTRGDPPARLSFNGYVLESASPQSINGAGDGSDEGDGSNEGEGEEGEGEGVGMQDESLQLPLSSVLNSCVAHQVFAHHALSQMNWQSDSRAARGGSYLAYQSFMFLCSCSWGAAESLQLPPSSALNSFAMHQDLAKPFSQMNWQSDALAARGGS